MGARSKLLLGAAVVTTHPAYAQRTDNNAVTAAEDAFGKSVGDQSIGIYNVMDVRGFSPLDAGNLRIEGLYFDLAANVNQRVSSGSSIRVGISAQGYPFPAPTGVVDYQLTKPGDKLLTSVGLTYGPWRGVTGEVDLQLPLDGDRLGIAAGVDVIHDGSSYGSISKTISTALVGRYAPRKGIEIMPFWSRARDSDFEAQPTIFTRHLLPNEAPFLPKRIARNTFTGQPWADYAGVQSNYGVVARADLLGLDLGLGVFRSKYTTERNASDLLYGADADGGVARRYILTDLNNTGDSLSGELRIARSMTEGRRQHTIVTSLRARDRTLTYGGTDVQPFFPSRYDVPDYRPEPIVTNGPKIRDRVMQTTVGLAYEGKWLNVGELTIGIQKTRYVKRLIDPALAIQSQETRDNPLLVSAAGALYITPQLAAYAGYTRGLEDGPVAPGNAANRDETPPAIRTRQVDAGFRWKVSPGVSMVAGVFEVAKPYYNVDSTTNVFRQLGNLRHRGIEFSLTGQIAPNLRAVIGNSLIDAKVSGDLVDRRVIGPKPVGAFVRHTIVSLNYRLPTNPKLSFDAFFEGSSGRTANAANTLTIPARAVMHLGMRYRFKIDGKPVLFRAQVANVTNTFGWTVSNSGGFTPNGSRRFLVSLSADI
jgi:iron complex outermembrane recepter protein